MILLALIGCRASEEPDGPPPICRDATPWQTGTDAFRDATSDWGLDAMDVIGIRFDAVDVDGDGWVDLAVRTGDAADDPATEVRNAWLLRNTRPAVATSYAFVNPPLAVVFGLLVGGEHAGWPLAVATPLIVGAVVLVVVGKKTS